MATSENLGLYLPTRDDYISVKRDISDNMEIIDAAVGGNIQSITKLNKLGTATVISAQTLEQMKTNLMNAINAINTSELIAIRISPGFSSDGFTMNTTYGGYAFNILKENGVTNYFSCILSNNIGENMVIGYNNGNWFINSVDEKLRLSARVSDVEFNHTDLNGEVYTEFEFTLKNGDTLGYNQYLLRFNHRMRRIYVYGRNSNNQYILIYSLGESPLITGSFTIPANGSQSFVLPSDGVYLLAGHGDTVILQNGVFLIGGYATASRCSVVNLSGISAVTINNSNTSSLTFTASNSNSSGITFNIIKLQ